jgi:2-isopropylmalate synthase
VIHPLIYDWNQVESKPSPGVVALHDETLRDGLQSSSVRYPIIEQKMQILHLIDALGIDTADIGLPGAGPQFVRDAERLAHEIADCRLHVKPNCAARTLLADIKPIVEISQRVGIPLECFTFIGSSAIRRYTEDWTPNTLERRTEEAVSFAAREGLPVTYVTEDTTRTDPETLRRLYRAAIHAGASRLCITDTVGHATPAGATAVVRFVAEVAKDCGVEVGIDWHGHRDRDMAVINAVSALEAGATRLHGTALGIGERVGNTPMDLLLVNLVLMGYLERDLTRLNEYCAVVSRACDIPIPPNYPVVGEGAFRTATGTHAAAVIKALRKKDRALADAVYSSVPAHLVGRQQEIQVGPMSGRSNVVFWLEQHQLPVSDSLVDKILARAKDSTHILRDQEIMEIVYETEQPGLVSEVGKLGSEPKNRPDRGLPFNAASP